MSQRTYVFSILDHRKTGPEEHGAAEEGHEWAHEHTVLKSFVAEKEGLVVGCESASFCESVGHESNQRW